MSRLTKIVTASSNAEELNQEIKRQEAEGWFLRGTPILLGEFSVMLTFESDDDDSVEFTSEFPDDIPEDVDDE